MLLSPPLGYCAKERVLFPFNFNCNETDIISNRCFNFICNIGLIKCFVQIGCFNYI